MLCCHVVCGYNLVMSNTPEPLLLAHDEGLQPLEPISHAELNNIYRNSYNEDGKTIVQRAIYGGFERVAEAKKSSGVQGFDEGTPHKLGDFGTEITGNFADLGGFESLPHEANNIPDIYYKRIPNSDEVAVVVRLNNGTTAENSSVAIAVVKQINGIPQIANLNGVNAGSRSLYTIVSEQDFDLHCANAGTALNATNRDSKLITGQMSLTQYEQKYDDDMGTPIATAIAGRDERLRNSREKEGDKAKQEMENTHLIERLEARYLRAMQDALDQQQNVIDTTQAELNTAQTSVQEQRQAIYNEVNLESLFRAAINVGEGATSDEELMQLGLAIGRTPEEINEAIAQARAGSNSQSNQPAEAEEPQEAAEENNQPIHTAPGDADPDAETAPEKAEEPQDTAKSNPSTLPQQETQNTTSTPDAEPGIDNLTPVEESFLQAGTAFKGHEPDVMLALAGLPKTLGGLERLNALIEEANRRKGAQNAQ